MHMVITVSCQSKAYDLLVLLSNPQGDHSLALQILKHEWHKVKEENKSQVCAWVVCYILYELWEEFVLFCLATFTAYDTSDG